MTAILFRFYLIACISLSFLIQAGDTIRQRPNIVFILADDLGIGDVHCYGKDRNRISTPNIDALAAGGLRFTDAHVNASVCVPVRVAIMTGRYPWRFGRPQAGGPWGYLGPRFSPDTYTLGTLFKTAGYHASYIGKWHLGTVMKTLDNKVQNTENVDYTEPLLTGPRDYGFEDSFILPGSLDMYPYAFVRNHVWQGEVTARKGWSAFNRIGPAAQDFHDHEVIETFYREAESVISGLNGKKPLFLYLALTAPHTPTSPGKHFKGRSQLGVYGDFVMEVDHAVERVIKALKRKGIYENTLILFSSDHGAAPYAGNILKATSGQIRDLEKLGHYSSGDYRGYKFSVYEGGLRVPLIAHWPGVIQAGGECHSLVGLNDLMATFAEVTDTKLEPQQGPDSISFAELFRNPGMKGERNHLVIQSTGPFVVRSGDWKLCLCPGSGSHLDFGNEPKSADAWRKAVETFGRQPGWNDLIRYPFVQLFNLKNDPSENHNLAAQHPEITLELVNMLRKWIEQGRSTEGRAMNNDRDRISIHQRLPEFIRNHLD